MLTITSRDVVRLMENLEERDLKSTELLDSIHPYEPKNYALDDDPLAVIVGLRNALAILALVVAVVALIRFLF